MTMESAQTCKRRVGVRLLGSLLLPLAALAVACGSTSPMASSPSMTESTTTNTTSPTRRAATARPNTSANSAFVGDWHVHGCSLRVVTDTKAEQVCFFGGEGVSEINTLVLTSSRHPRSVAAKIAKVTFVSNDTGRVVANPFPNTSDAVGDVFDLTFVAPHLLKSRFLVTHRAPIDVADDNPYWCGEGLATSLEYLCGA
jgi:hypothetical protein